MPKIRGLEKGRNAMMLVLSTKLLITLLLPLLTDAFLQRTAFDRRAVRLMRVVGRLN